MNHPAHTQVYIQNGYDDFTFSIINEMSAWDLVELIDKLAPRATAFSLGYPNGQHFHYDI